MLTIERVYSSPNGRSFRILVDRLWPRSIRKDEAKVDLWLKDIAPSDGLRNWFGHDPDKWDDFRKKHFQEPDRKKELVDQITDKTKEVDVVLLYGAKDEAHNNAMALKEHLETKQRM